MASGSASRCPRSPSCRSSGDLPRRISRIVRPLSGSGETSPLLVQPLARVAAAMLIQSAKFRIAFHSQSRFRITVVQTAAVWLFVDEHLLLYMYHHFPPGWNINRIERLAKMPLQPLI